MSLPLDRKSTCDSNIFSRRAKRQQASREKAWKNGYKTLAKEISKELPKQKNSIVLELGYGKGQLGNEISKILKRKIIAIDVSPQAFNDNALIVKGDAERSAIKNSSIDTIFSNFFVSWLNEDKLSNVLKSCYDMLKSGGKIVISDFSPFPKNPAQEIAILQGRKENNLLPSEKWRSAEEVSVMLESTGFKEVKTRFFDWHAVFPYETAVEQLEKWNAKEEFIEKAKPGLKKHGLELPQSFILTGIK